MKATLTPFIDLVVHGQALYSLLLISRVVPGTEVRHLGGGGGSPVLHILPAVHIFYVICCFSASFFQFLHVFFQCIISRKKNCLLCPPFLLTCVSTPLCTATAVRAETAKSETRGSQNTLLCSALLCCFLHEFFWGFCCFFYWWADAYNQTCTHVCACVWGEDCFHFTCLAT